MTRNKSSIPPVNWDAENQAQGLLNQAQLDKKENLKGSLNTPRQGVSFVPCPPWNVFTDSECFEWQESQFLGKLI